MYGSILKDSIIIRKFRPADLSEVVEVDREASGGHHPLFLTTFYESHRETFLVAVESGRVVGFILGFKPSLLEGRIFWLAVRPSHRNRGIGRRLLISILGIFEKLGAIGVTLEVRISNIAAQSLYAGLGFQILSLCPYYYSDGEAAIIMRKLLLPSRITQHLSQLS